MQSSTHVFRIYDENSGVHSTLGKRPCPGSPRSGDRHRRRPTTPPPPFNPKAGPAFKVHLAKSPSPRKPNGQHSVYRLYEPDLPIPASPPGTIGFGRSHQDASFSFHNQHSLPLSTLSTNVHPAIPDERGRSLSIEQPIPSRPLDLVSPPLSSTPANDLPSKIVPSTPSSYHQNSRSNTFENNPPTMDPRAECGHTRIACTSCHVEIPAPSSSSDIIPSPPFLKSTISRRKGTEKILEFTKERDTQPLRFAADYLSPAKEDKKQCAGLFLEKSADVKSLLDSMWGHEAGRELVKEWMRERLRELQQKES